MKLSQKIQEYYTKRGLAYPDLKSASMFLACEAAEVMDAVLRMEPHWIRNNQRQVDLAEELGDVLMMVLVTASVADIDPVAALEAKLDRKLSELAKAEIEKLREHHYRNPVV